MIKISIIVPTYNNEKYIKKCLDSLLNQTYSNVEVVVVNDGSLDNTVQILEQYQAKYSNLIFINQQNQGVSSARNNGIKNATGEYLMFVDSDDWIDLDMISNMVKYIEDGADIVKCGYVKDNLKKQIEFKVVNENLIYTSENKHKLCQKVIADYSLNSACTQIFNKDLITENFNSNIKIGEDLLFNLGIFTKCKKMVLLKDCYYHYFDNDNSATTTLDINKVLKRCDDAIFVYSKLYEFSKEFNLEKEEKKNIAYRIIKELNMKLIQLYKIDTINKNDRIKLLKKYFNDEVIIDSSKKINFIDIFKKNNKNSLFVFLIKNKNYILYDFILNKFYNTKDRCN